MGGVDPDPIPAALRIKEADDNEADEKDVDLSRRAFVKLVGASAACACSGVLGVGGCTGNPTATTPSAPEGSYRVRDGHLHLTLSAVGILLGVGGAVKLTLASAAGPERKLIIVRSGEADYRAFANACTHNGKELDYLHAQGLLACCGRSSRFDLDGEVIHGPAEEPLPSYPIAREGDELVIEIQAGSEAGSHTGLRAPLKNVIIGMIETVVPACLSNTG